MYTLQRNLGSIIVVINLLSSAIAKALIRFGKMGQKKQLIKSPICTDEKMEMRPKEVIDCRDASGMN